MGLYRKLFFFLSRKLNAGLVFPVNLKKIIHCMDVKGVNLTRVKDGSGDPKGVSVVLQAFFGLSPNGIWIGQCLTSTGSYFDCLQNDRFLTFREVTVVIDVQITRMIVDNMLKYWN